MRDFSCKFLPLDSVEFKLADSSKGFFSGYASIFNSNDAYNDTILPGAYEATLKNRVRPVSMHFNHVGSALLAASDFPTRIGVWKTIEEDDSGLYVEGKLTSGHPVADAVLASMKHGVIDGLSIGYYADDYEPKDGGGRILKSLSLVEISVVEVPAEDNARISVVAGKNRQNYRREIENINSIRDAERLLRDAAGLSNESAKHFIAQVKLAILRDSEVKNSQNDPLALLRQSLSNLTIPKGSLK